MRLVVLTALGFTLGACGESDGTTAPRGLGLVYCDNPDVAAPSCTLDGYSLADDSALRAKLEGCANGGCHGTSLPATTWSMDLSGSVQDALAALTQPGQTGVYDLVDPIEADCSQMLAEVSERPTGVRMPAGGPYWSTAEVDCFRSYLNELYPPVSAE